MQKRYVLKNMHKNVVNEIKVLLINSGLNKIDLFTLTNKSIKIKEELYPIKDLFFFIDLKSENNIVFILLTRGKILYEQSFKPKDIEKIKKFVDKNKEYLHN